MNKARDIINTINGNGGLDLSFMRYNARQENKSLERYMYEYVKDCYECHGNTARAVIDYYLY